MPLYQGTVTVMAHVDSLVYVAFVDDTDGQTDKRGEAETRGCNLRFFTRATRSIARYMLRQRGCRWLGWLSHAGIVSKRLKLS